jgi:hypothetical protein
LRAYQSALRNLTGEDVTMIDCPGCSWKVSLAGDRLPPWCPQCGSDLKPGAVKCEPAQVATASGSAPRADIATVQRMLAEAVGPDPADGPPVSRAYEHIACGAITVASGDDLVRLETPFRPLDETYCCTCATYVPLHNVRWTDSGEVITDYRRRVKKSVGFWRGLYLAIFCNAYKGAVNLHLDSKGRPLQRQAQ